MTDANARMGLTPTYLIGSLNRNTVSNVGRGATDGFDFTSRAYHRSRSERSASWLLDSGSLSL